MSLETFNLICSIWSLVGVSSFILLQFVRAPYGRHLRKGWGTEIPNNLGWVLMEMPSFLIILYFYCKFQAESICRYVKYTLAGSLF